MTPNQSWFETYTLKHYDFVLLGNNKACKVIGIGTIRLKLNDGIERVLQGVKHVPELKRNLISLGMLDENGYSVKLELRSLRLSNGSLIVMKGVRTKCLYYLLGKTVIWYVSAVTNASVDQITLWHCRLGHVSER